MNIEWVSVPANERHLIDKKVFFYLCAYLTSASDLNSSNIAPHTMGRFRKDDIDAILKVNSGRYHVYVKKIEYRLLKSKIWSLL